MAIASNFPAIKPSLSLDFANTKRLDSRVTFTRTTTATYYDGVTTAMAEQNLLLQSQDFTTTWTLFNVTASANTVAAPDGTTTADTLTETTATSFHLAGQAGSIIASTQSTVSIFAKANTAQYLQILVNNGSGHYISVIANLTGGTITQTNNSTATLDSSSITSVGGGWYRVVGSFTFANTTGLSVYFGMSNSATPTLGGSGIISYTGNASNNFYLWGAQLEQRSSVTAYTATTTQAITNYIPVLLTAASGVARFQHNPTTDESLGLLIEEQRTNFQTYSEQFDNAAWTKNASSITANTIVAPDGALTGDKLVEDSTNAAHFVRQVYTSTVGTTYTSSVYLKAAERTSAVVIHLNGSAFYGVSVDLLTGVLSAPPFDLGLINASSTATVTSVGNGWYRVSIALQQVSATNLQQRVSLQSGSNGVYTGNGYSGIYIWGAQIEAGAFPTSYIATTAATVTRNADAASMTGSNFTSWFNNAEGTLYAEAAAGSFTTFPVYAMLHDGTSNNYIVLQNNSSGFGRLAGAVSGVSWTNATTANTASVNVSGRYASVYKVSDQAICLNNGTVATSTNGTLPVVNQLKIGDWRTTGNSINGTIKKLSYYPLRVTNAQLQALTS